MIRVAPLLTANGVAPGGLYDHTDNTIILASQIDPALVRATLLHELIHADDHRIGVDLGTLEGLAWSEAHAAEEAYYRGMDDASEAVRETALASIVFAIGDRQRAEELVEEVLRIPFEPFDVTGDLLRDWP